VQGDGGPWLVYELPPLDYDRRTSPCLAFESDGSFHRVRQYPADWRTLGDQALLVLRHRR
ncbi:MAG TPA: hypothetical protein VEA99_18220, partial [Gemmatimonadaceae bacterium]|nr:hypothetical protein [Gemmatimonadaceae bacterium]